MKKILRQPEVERLDGEYEIPQITPELVASMPIKDIEEGLLDMGLDPYEPLPEGIRQLICEDKDASADRAEQFVPVAVSHKK